MSTYRINFTVNKDREQANREITDEAEGFDDVKVVRYEGAEQDIYHISFRFLVDAQAWNDHLSGRWGNFSPIETYP
jgi:hypothetical protein